MQIGNDSFVFKYPVTCKQKISKNYINFIEFNVNVYLICANHVMTCIILHTRRPNCQKKSVTHLVFMFQLTFIFAFWEAEKHVFHITPFRPTRYVLMRLKWLEVSNRVRKWNKVKNFIFVELKLELCQLEMLIFIYKLMCKSSLINNVSFLFCEFNRVTSWIEGKNIF